MISELLTPSESEGEFGNFDTKGLWVIPAIFGIVQVVNTAWLNTKLKKLNEKKKKHPIKE